MDTEKSQMEATNMNTEEAKTEAQATEEAPEAPAGTDPKTETTAKEAAEAPSAEAAEADTPADSEASPNSSTGRTAMRVRWRTSTISASARCATAKTS